MQYEIVIKTTLFYGCIVEAENGAQAEQIAESILTSGRFVDWGSDDCKSEIHTIRRGQE